MRRRMTSPSKMASFVTVPRRRRNTSRLSVVFPADGKPVNHTTSPLFTHPPFCLVDPKHSGVCINPPNMPTALARRSVSLDRDKALTPEVVDPRIADVEQVARWLDYAFELPNGFRFGIAGFIGLIPGIGDLIDALISLYIVLRAMQLGLPRVALARMTVNIAIEGIAGAVPILGDLFDIAFKANRRNYELLRSHLAQPARQSKSDWLFLILTLLVLIGSVALPVFGLVELFKHLRFQ